ncbi:MAG: hypothetical protein M3R59_08055 [Verrucomicrobiota bacterium]|nr:hypothetical protein [Verrucomicrobiota bacterium]
MQLQAPFRRLASTVVICVLCAVRAGAAPPEEYDFHGEIFAVNPAAKTMVVGTAQKKITILLTADTFYYLNLKESSLREMKPGEAVMGIVKVEKRGLVAYEVLASDKKK